MYDKSLTCDRCGSAIDGVSVNIQLFDCPTVEEHGQFTVEIGPEMVCCKCMDELMPMLEQCDFNCLDCLFATKWGANAKSCLNIQNEMGLISDEDLTILEYIKHWQLVRKGKSITSTIYSIKNDITERHHLRLQG